MAEFEFKPNYPGLLVTVLIMATGAVFLAFVTHYVVGGFPPANVVEWLMIAFLYVVLTSIVLGLMEALFDTIRVALSGMRKAWRVRVTREGLHYPLLSTRPIPWQAIRELSVQHGHNGKEVWLELDHSLKLFHPSLMNLALSLLHRKRVSYLRLGSHKFQIDVPAFEKALLEMAPTHFTRFHDLK